MTDRIQQNTAASPRIRAVFKTLSIFTKPGQFVLVAMLALLAGWLTGVYLTPSLGLAATLAATCLGLWATGVVPEYWTALAFIVVAMVTQIAPPETVFSGFQTSTFWLLFSGLVLGAAIKHTHLDQRAAALLVRLPFKSYAELVYGIVAFSLALAFIVPSSIGRIMILLPVISALTERVGFSSESKGRTGALCAACFATFAPAFAILPANAPNMILVGMSENLYDTHFSYWQYLQLHFPVLGLAKSVVIVLLTLGMFPDKLPQNMSKTVDTQAPMSGREWLLMTILGLCLLFWLTDGLHPIGPAWVGLIAALACLWPSANLTQKTCINQDLSYGSLIFVAGIMGLGAVIAYVGLGESLVQSAGNIAHLSKDAPIWNVTILTGLSTLVAMATNLPGVPAVMTPIAADLATATGLPLETVLMTQVLAFSNVFLPFQAPPLVAAIQVGKIPIGAVMRLCLALFAISLVVLIPLDFLWWHLLGYL